MLNLSYRVVYIQGAPKKITQRSVAHNSSTVQGNFVIFCVAVERLYLDKFAQLCLATDNNAKAT